MSSENRFILHKLESLFQGYFRVDRYHVSHVKFNGSWSRPYTREVFERAKQVAGVLLFDPQHDKIALVEQFRSGPLANNDEPWLTEVVLGMVDADETPEQAARREAMEEAGCEVTDLCPIANYYSSPGGTSEQIHYDFVGLPWRDCSRCRCRARSAGPRASLCCWVAWGPSVVWWRGELGWPRRGWLSCNSSVFSSIPACPSSNKKPSYWAGGFPQQHSSTGSPWETSFRPLWSSLPHSWDFRED